jgi:hypothetical protein
VFTPAGKRWIVIALVVATAWFGATVAFWANEPLHDYAPTGVVPNLATPEPKDTVETSVRITCHSPWSSNARPIDPLPVLEAPRAYQDTPCATSHRDGRLMLFVDIAIYLVALAGGVVLLTRRSSLDAAQLKPAIA